MSILKPTSTRLSKSPLEADWPSSADLIITRLPAALREKISDGEIEYLAQKSFKALNNNSLAFVVVPSLKEDKSKPYRTMEIFQHVGFNYIDKIIWRKDKFIPVQGDKRLNNVYEEVLMFVKGEDYHLDRRSLAFTEKTEREIADLFAKSNEPDGSDISACLGNVWASPVEGKDGLSAHFVKKCIVLCDLLPNSLVLAPYGYPSAIDTACEELGHSFWGCGFPAKRKRKNGDSEEGKSTKVRKKRKSKDDDDW